MNASPTMDTIEKIKAEYFAQTQELLRSHPAELKLFEELWAAERLKAAYIAAQEATRKFGLVRSAMSDKADEDFFWTFVH